MELIGVIVFWCALAALGQLMQVYVRWQVTGKWTWRWWRT